MTSIETRVRDYYEQKLRAHGTTPAAADWNSQQSQELRFRQLARLWDEDPGASVLDYGCGYGAMAVWLRARGHAGPYIGYDISTEMTDAARRQAAPLAGCQFTSSRGQLTAADYAVASGIFNVKLETPDEQWRQYMVDTLHELAALGRRGWGFNVLSLASDPDRRRVDLYYADAAALFEYCRATFSRHVALLHDYPLYEFTLLVRT